MHTQWKATQRARLPNLPARARCGLSRSAEYLYRLSPTSADSRVDDDTPARKRTNLRIWSRTTAVRGHSHVAPTYLGPDGES